jgi:hypothetical protein
MKKNRVFIIIGIVLAVLIITNPSLKKFSEYKYGIGGIRVVNIDEHFYKMNNFFIFSTFRQTNGRWNKENRYYIGILGNFFEY